MFEQLLRWLYEQAQKKKQAPGQSDYAPIRKQAESNLLSGPTVFTDTPRGTTAQDWHDNPAGLTGPKGEPWYIRSTPELYGSWIDEAVRRYHARQQERGATQYPEYEMWQKPNDVDLMQPSGRTRM